MLMEQLTNVKMEKYELIEKGKKNTKEIATLQGKVQAFEMALNSAMQEKDKAEQGLRRAQGMPMCLVLVVCVC